MPSFKISSLVVAFVTALAPLWTQATDWTTLDYLYEIKGKGTVAGVHNKLSRTPNSFSQLAQAKSGKVPGLWSGDFLFDAENIANRWTMVNEAKRQYEQGALVNIMWHACNPTLSEPCNWSSHCSGDGPWSDISDSDWQQLITDGTRLNNRWKQMMDDISQYLVYLRDANVDVMFRPLHEMNQNCFWWGGRPGPNGSRRLYQITHDYLTNVKKLDNLVWTWNIQDFGTLAQDSIDYNPGSQYWEVATLDVYEGFQTWKYDVMRSVAGSKPFAVGECDKLPDANRLVNENQWTFFMSWSELTFETNTDAEIRALYNSNQAITLDEMPGNWNNRPAPSPVAPSPVPVTRTIRSVHNTYLSGWNDGTVRLMPHSQGWEKWTVTPSTTGTVLLRSAHGTYLSAWNNGTVRLQPKADAWERWTQVSNNDGTVSYRSVHGTFLSAWPSGTPVRLSPHNQAWERFRVA